MAQYEDFRIDQGTDVAIELHLENIDKTPKNLTGHSVSSLIKKTYNSDSDSTVAFNGSISDPPTDGIITLSLTNTQTDNMIPGRWMYDVEISYIDSAANTIVERILEGKIEIAPSVTK